MCGNAIPTGQISQETEFYYREQVPVYTTTTNKEGKWEIKDVDKNNYTLVKQQPGFEPKVKLKKGLEEVWNWF